MASSIRRCLAIVCAALAADCGSAPPVSPSPDPPAGAATPIRVLMITATAAFRHESIPAARSAVRSLAAQSGAFTVTATEDLRELTAARLASIDVLMFALTTGELALDADQKTAIAGFVAGGGGFIGLHSAADTLYQWPEYGQLVGAYFKEHPWTQTASVIVEDSGHPAVAGAETPFRILEEFYTFQRNPRGSVHVLLSLDPRSVAADGDFPLAWTQTIGRGRSYYNALGHFDATWNDPWFRRQLAAAIQWTAAR